MRRKNRKYLRRASGAGVTKQQWNEILDKYSHCCAYCGIHEIIPNVLGESITIDHVIPLSKGGKHSPDNVVPACINCNIEKGVKVA